MTVQTEGKREVKRKITLYNLDLILAIGCRVRSPRGTQFRQWATANLREYLVKGFVMDDERLKNPGDWDHFDELLARIREIRASEKRFYQKVRDLFALSSDYQVVQEQTNLFFAFVQNKLLFAATGHTAAELIVDRADPNSPNMALTTWKGSRVRKQDVVVAKNYLSADEIDTLERLVTIFLEQAELRVKQKNDLTLERTHRYKPSPEGEICLPVASATGIMAKCIRARRATHLSSKRNTGSHGIASTTSLPHCLQHKRAAPFIARG